jgi:CheY-like chemotaxis protein/HPt (histidine-containing phosphotransfer) domain-containing protein
MSDLMRTDNLDETQKSFFEDIKKMSRTLLQIINDILDISKIEVGKMELTPIHFNLLELYDNICSISRFTAESKDLEFRHSFDPEIPHIIYGDDVRIRQVVTNIVNNAVKYTQEGYVDFKVQHVLKDGRNYIAFIIKDTGIGIKKEDFPKLFNTFQQLDTKNNRGIMGTGLGLVITKNLVSMMDGIIDFTSEYGAGSEFTVLLPLIKGDANKMEKKSEGAKVMAGEDVKALVVDDNRINLRVALAFLAVHRIYADTAESGACAIEKIERNDYDLVFMDHMMPEMDGIEAARRIRAMAGEKYRRLPIIALSANAVSGARESFLRAGMNDFISKPIDPADLNRKLAKWLPGDKIIPFEKPDRKEQTLNPGAPGAAAIDQIEGVKNIGGDEELYRQIIRSFQQDHGGDYEKIAAALEEEDIVLAHRLAHTLKSTAALLGAFELQRAALDIEKAASEENISAAKDRLPQLGKALKAVLDEVEALLQRSSPQETAAPKGGGRAADKEKRLLLISKLTPLLKSGNTGVLELLKDIRENFTALDGLGEILVKQIEDFEFDAAFKTLLDIRRSYEL